MIRQTALLAIIAALASTACTAERSLAPSGATSSASRSVALAPPQVPLLYIVDGVRLQKDEVPALSGDQIASVLVVKGRKAIKDYGPDASYGAVVITTKLSAPRA